MTPLPLGPRGPRRRALPRPLHVRVFSFAVLAAALGVLFVLSWLQGRFGAAERKAWVDATILLLGVGLLLAALVGPPLAFARVRRGAAQGGRLCPECGARRRRGTEFCLECGWRTPGEETAAQRPRGPAW